MSMPAEVQGIPPDTPRRWGVYYAERGWLVIPLHSIHEGRCTCGNPACKSAGKHPRTPNGLKDATRDQQVMAAWKRRWPGSNIGIVTGAESGLVVLDIDPRHDGDESLTDLERRYGDLPHTIEALTGGGGRHIYFQHPGGRVKSGPLPGVSGVDLKADGGYVVAPPSTHVSGRQYLWEVACHPDDTPLAAVPAWLLNLVQGGSAGSRSSPAAEVGPLIPEGQRNQALTSLAGSMRRRGMSAQEILPSLLEANRRRCSPPLPEDEVRRIAESVQRYDPQAPAPEITGRTDEDGLPEIVANNRQLRHVTSDALRALEAANDPPVLFQRGGILTRVRFDESGTPRLEFVSEAALRGHLARAANWFAEKRTSQGDIVRVRIAPPLDVTRDIAGLPGWSFPPIEGISQAPVFDAQGALVTEPGYHAGPRLWYASNGLEVRPPVDPTAAQIGQARSLLLDELLGDFPFTNDASRAHALAALLLPFCRLLVKGPTPLHVVDAPSPGTGKSLLADMIVIPATAGGARVMAEGRDDDEWRKRITAALAEAPVYILIDNVKARLSSAALSAALTAGVWADRFLGKTRMIVLPVRTVWLATGNNVALSEEMARRTAWIRLDAKVDRPWARGGFKHPDLRSWAQEHRGDLVAAALTLIQAWIAAGRPHGYGRLGNFEGWVSVMGGILEVAGVPGFLGNVDELYRQANEEIQEWEEFLAAWWQTHGNLPVRTDDLFRLASENSLLDRVLDAKTERGQKTRLGMALGRQRDRIIGGYRIEAWKDDCRGRRGYRLSRMDAAAEPDAPRGGDDPWV